MEPLIRTRGRQATREQEASLLEHTRRDDAVHFEGFVPAGHCDGRRFGEHGAQDGHLQAMRQVEAGVIDLDDTIAA